MKKQLALFALLVFVLAGCQNTAEGETRLEEVPVPGSELPEESLTPRDVSTPQPESTPTVIPEEELSAGEEVVPAVTEETAEPSEEHLDGDGQRPTDEEVLEAYREAEAAYRWFEECDEETLMLDQEDTIVLPAPVGGGEYTFARVTRPGLNSMDELRAYLKALFSDEIVDELLSYSHGVFTDSPDGGLYARISPAAPMEEKSGISVAVLWPEETASMVCTVQATVEENQTCDFSYQKVGDKWVFTQFEPIF